jgi:hypothetical protein
MSLQSMDGVRAAVRALDREVTLLGEHAPAGQGAGLDPLRASWQALRDALALGPDPEYRNCPYCGAIGMRAATRCGDCWKVLVPPPATSAGHRDAAR